MCVLWRKLCNRSLYLCFCGVLLEAAACLCLQGWREGALGCLPPPPPLTRQLLLFPRQLNSNEKLIKGFGIARLAWLLIGERGEEEEDGSRVGRKREREEWEEVVIVVAVRYLIETGGCF